MSYKKLLVLGADQSVELQFRVKVIRFEEEYVSVSVMIPDADNDYTLDDSEVLRFSRKQAGSLMKAIDEWLDD